MATTNNPLTAAAKAIAAAQAKVASVQRAQNTAIRSYKTSVNALATAQKAVKTLTSLKGGLTLKNAQIALSAAQRVVGAAQTIVKSTQMAVNSTTNTVRKLTGQGGAAGNPAIDNAIRQRVPYNAQTNTGTGPTMSSGQGLLNIPGATQIARNQADPEGNVNASRPEEFSSDADRLGVSSTENTPVTAAVADASGGSNAVASSNPIVQPAIGTQVTQETTTVSGGGTTYVTSGNPKANAASDAVQPAIDAKQAEINNFYKENESPLSRKRAGNPMTAEEYDAYKAKESATVDPLRKEKSALVAKRESLKTPESTEQVVVPNTTTTTSTTVTSKAAALEPVDPENDESLGQLVSEDTRYRGSVFGTDIEQVDLTAAAAGGGSQRIDREEDGPGTTKQDVAPATAEQDLLNANEPVGLGTPEPVPLTPAEQAVLNANEPVGLGTPEPVPLTPAEQAVLDANDPKGISTGESDIIGALKAKTALQPTLQARNKQPASADWRVRLQLAPLASYLYRDPDPGILAPLAATDGVIFPYTPSIETSYNANYDTYDLTHSNFRGYFYKGSKVNDINIRAIFTAQDTKEAGYMLAVIHFFRSVTKMFYGANDPLRGAPPPLTYLTGLGQHQFNQHPCVVQSFNYSLPSEVDYIRAEAPNNYGTSLLDRRVKTGSYGTPSQNRLRGTLTKPNQGATPAQPPAQPLINQNVNNLTQATYVPTKIEISIVLLPINTRSQVSQQFNMQGFANGQLLKAGFW